MAKYRAEKWELSYGIETTYGETPTGATSATNLFGVFQDATLSNPGFDYQLYWAMNPTARNYFVGYKGKATTSGNIGNIVLINGCPLCLPISNGANSTIVHSGPVGGVYTHTINESINLPSFRLVCCNIADSESAPETLTRWFVGGKANSAAFHCEEGNILMMDIAMTFKMPYYTATGDAHQIDPWYDANATRTQRGTLTYPCTEPYYFSQAKIKVKLPIFGLTETTLTTIKSWKLEIRNNLEPKYYLSTGANDSGINIQRVPFEIWEGKREYVLTLSADLVDDAHGGTFKKDTPFLELLNQGMNGTSFTGAGFDVVFDRSSTGDGSDIIEFITPADYAPECGGDNQGSLLISAPFGVGGTGIIPVQMEFRSRTLKIIVKDALSGASYPI